MNERMSKEDRKDQLSHIMLSRHAKAQSQADFTAASLAAESGISTVWFYALGGKQFRRLRAKLPGPIPTDETLIAKLRKEVAQLHAQFKELKEKYEISIKEKLAQAIRHIEQLDKENRMLRETVTALQKSLNDSKLVVFTEVPNNSAVSFKDHI